ncbi:diacylglycerol kinase family protein [Exiguobacterium aestuarii]|uniref:Diacylglycerol kinase family protein n=1 Tax=Exiguobacterium aestuarii TaxID=273527 RepID=A0ABW2PK00_9BACL|nr:diacylglycerol kinase family protein [Exiguobacterium aestuarii]MCT4786659.1 diacylglycerol kinase family protein [Exiguobacterium aestuarii]
MRPFRVACEGILHAIRTERNMRIHLIAALLVFAVAIWLQTTKLENLVLLAWVTLVISLELMNTAIERAVNLVTQEVHPLAKQAKDVAAGAVLVASIGAAVTALIIFGPRLWNVLY